MATIFIEGTLEKPFLIELLKQMGKDIDKFNFINSGGYTNLPKLENKLKVNNDLEEKNIIIFDADGKENDGGYERRLAELKITLEQMCKLPYFSCHSKLEFLIVFVCISIGVLFFKASCGL